MDTFGIALFHSTHEAMKAEDMAKTAQLNVRIIPTPEKIFASCGFSLKYPLDKEVMLKTLLDSAGVRYEGLYHANRTGLQTTYEEVREIQ